MPTYKISGVNVGAFNLGESDKVITIFSAERGLVKAVAKGARKPGSRIAGRAELLNVNSYLIATARTLDIITQAETVETFPKLRTDLARLAFGLYYAELTQQFGAGLIEEAELYCQRLREAIRLQAEGAGEPLWLCLKFELMLIDMLGYRPELTACVICRDVLTDYKVAAFHKEWGGLICRQCFEMSSVNRVAEREDLRREGGETRAATRITPLVWRYLILAAAGQTTQPAPEKALLRQPLQAVQRLVQGYLEQRLGRRLKALDLVTGSGAPA